MPGVQVLFKKDVTFLVSSFEEVGNLFEEDSKYLFALDSKGSVETVKNVIIIGHEQYNTFVEERFEKRTKEVTSVISRNRLPLIKSPLGQKADKMKVQVAALRMIVPYSSDYTLLDKVVKESSKRSLNMRIIRGPHLWRRLVD